MKQVRWQLAVLLCLAMCCLMGASTITPPQTSANGACVVEVDSGRVLCVKNADQQMPMASTTKIMTALVAIEKGNLEQVVTATSPAVGVEGSSIYLKEGEQFTLKDLLYGLMLRSGNDSAVAIACAVGGSVDGFVEMMNQKAAELGATHTHFANPHGLPADGHYTTARDLAIISAYAMRNPVFAEIVSTKSITIQPDGEGEARLLQNKNKLLTQFNGATGIKTGYTKEAGKCLVGSAERDGKRVVAVVLGAPDMWNDVQTLMEVSLNAMEHRVAVHNQDPMGTVAVENGLEDQVMALTQGEYALTLLKEESDALRVQVELPNTIAAPIQQGQELGQAVVMLGQEELARIPLVADRSVGIKTYEYHLQKVIDFWLRNVT